MFAAEIPVISLCTRLSRRISRASSKTGRTMDDITAQQDPRSRINQVIADRLPSTAEEIAEASGLDPVTTTALLHEMASRNRIMFNPLTKRFSLPRARPGAGIAA